MQVLCDLGTDCADCGPWRFNATGNGSDYQADMPIKRLLSKNVRTPTYEHTKTACGISISSYRTLDATTQPTLCQPAQVEVRLKRTVTKPAFLMPYTNPKFDVDVSAAMVNGGAVEMGLSQVCRKSDRQ
jgi:hypothetical protein